MFAMALFAMLWVATMTLLVDGAEANRMRFGVDALFVLACLAAFGQGRESIPDVQPSRLASTANSLLPGR